MLKNKVNEYGDLPFYSEKRISEIRTIHGREVLVNMYIHHSAIHNGDQGHTVLTIGFNPKSIENADTGALDDTNGTPLEKTRQQGIKLFEDIDITVKDYVQFDLYIESSLTAKDLSNEAKEASKVQLDILKEGLRSADSILLAWGPAGYSSLQSDSEFSNRLRALLAPYQDGIYWIKHNERYSDYSAPYTTSGQWDKKLEKIGENFDNLF